MNVITRRILGVVGIHIYIYTYHSIPLWIPLNPTYIYIYIYIYICTYTVYIYIHMHAYTYIYIYIYGRYEQASPNLPGWHPKSAWLAWLRMGSEGCHQQRRHLFSSRAVPKIVGKSWEIHGKSRGRSENHQKIMNNLGKSESWCDFQSEASNGLR